MHKKHINPPTLFNSTDFGFSQIVVSPLGKMVCISGQVAWDEHRNIIGENDLKIQANKTLENLQNAIEAAGGTLKDVVMLRIYVVNYKDADGA
ncbi:MAG: RidA family protein, partial [Chitinophagales bacterium]